MKDLPLGTIVGLVPEFAVKDLPLGRTHDDEYIQDVKKVLLCMYVYLVVPMVSNWRPLLLFLRRPVSAQYGHFQV